MRAWVGAETFGRTGATGAGDARMIRGRPPGKKPWMTWRGGARKVRLDRAG